MNISQKEYAYMVSKASPKSSLLKDCLCAFGTGGLICLAGQGLTDLYRYVLGFGLDDARCLTSVTLVFTAALFTMLSWYDNIARFAGAGTLVPITGFANAVVSPAMEFRTEGLVTGLGAKMFVIAGPVIVFGTISSVVYGLILSVFS